MTASRDAAPDWADLGEADVQLQLALAAADRRAVLHDLEHDLRGHGRTDFQVTGLIRGKAVTGRQVYGRQTCSPQLRAAAARLVSAGTVVTASKRGTALVATLDGRDIATTLTLILALDHVSSARYGDVEIIPRPVFS